MVIASHRRHFAIFVTQAKSDAIMIWTNGFDFFAIIKFLMRYYRSSFAINFFTIFDFFDNFLKLKKFAQTSYTYFLIKTKLQNNKSNNEILLVRASALFFILKLDFRLKYFNFYFFMILMFSYFFYLFLNSVLSSKGVGRKKFGGGGKRNTKSEK